MVKRRERAKASRGGEPKYSSSNSDSKSKRLRKKPKGRPFIVSADDVAVQTRLGRHVDDRVRPSVFLNASSEEFLPKFQEVFEEHVREFKAGMKRNNKQRKASGEKRAKMDKSLTGARDAAIAAFRAMKEAKRKPVVYK